MSTATLPARAGPVGEPAPLYEFTDSPLLLRQQQQESNARSYPRRLPLALKRARGVYVEDVEGRPLRPEAAAAARTLLATSAPRSRRLGRRAPEPPLSRAASSCSA